MKKQDLADDKIRSSYVSHVHLALLKPKLHSVPAAHVLCPVMQSFKRFVLYASFFIGGRAGSWVKKILSKIELGVAASQLKFIKASKRTHYCTKRPCSGIANEISWINKVTLYSVHYWVSKNVKILGGFADE